MKKGLCADLMLTFMKIGLFTFGGGYAMISMISDICVEKKKWITHDEMMNVTVVAESTPGPIAINCATFVGWRQAGMAGALCATLGIVLPSFAVIYAIARFCEGVAAPVWALNAFRGVKAAVDAEGALGILSGDLSRTAPGIAAAVIFGLLAAAVSRSREK